MRQRQEAVGVQRVGRSLQVFGAVFAGRHLDLPVAAAIGDDKAPAPRLDAGDRLGLADPPARAVGVDPAEPAQPLVVVEAVARGDAVDAVERGHRAAG